MKTTRKPQPVNANIKIPVGVGGRYSYRVMNSDGTPGGDWVRQKNLILIQGVTYGFTTSTLSESWYELFKGAQAGTGTTPNSAVLDGTYQQTGTTVTRESGTGSFVSGNVGDYIKFDTGERAKILSLTNSLTVEVDQSQTVGATGLTIYDTSRLYLDTWVKGTNTKDDAAGAYGDTYDTDTGVVQYWRTYNFSTETSARTYTEMGMSARGSGTEATDDLFSRLLFETPVTVQVDQFLQVRFDLICVTGNYRLSAPIDVDITGWPFQYQILSIASDGTNWDVVVSPDCSSHYAVGRPITIQGAVPIRTSITSISSTSSEFTVNATGHGRTIGDSITIEGTTPAGYNGEWTVATVPDANTLTVTSSINLGAGSGGTVRLSTPATWYDGTHTIASFPAANTIRITNANTLEPAGQDGTVQNSIAANAIITGKSFYATQASILDFGWGSNAITNKATLRVIAEGSMQTNLSHGTNPGTPSTVGISNSKSVSQPSLATQEQEITAILGTSTAVSQTIRQFLFGNTSQPTGRLYITFDERQRKDNGFILTVGYKIKWEPELD